MFVGGRLLILSNSCLAWFYTPSPLRGQNVRQHKEMILQLKPVLGSKIPCESAETNPSVMKADTLKDITVTPGLCPTGGSQLCHVSPQGEGVFSSGGGGAVFVDPSATLDPTTKR